MSLLGAAAVAAHRFKDPAQYLPYEFESSNNMIEFLLIECCCDHQRSSFHFLFYFSNLTFLETPTSFLMLINFINFISLCTRC